MRPSRFRASLAILLAPALTAGWPDSAYAHGASSARMGGSAYGSSLTCSPAGFYGSALGVGALAILDIATAPSSAHRYNQRRLSVAPMVDPARGSYRLSASWSPRRLPPTPARVGRGTPAWSPQSGAGPKSPGTAAALSLLSTAVPMVLAVPAGDETGGWMFLSGLVIGPSVGHFYAGHPARGVGTILARGFGTALGLASIVGCFD